MRCSVVASRPALALSCSAPRVAVSPCSFFHLPLTAIRRGEKAALFVFDEELGLLFRRTKLLGIDLEAFANEGNLIVEQVDVRRVNFPIEYDSAWKITACARLSSIVSMATNPPFRRSSP